MDLGCFVVAAGGLGEKYVTSSYKSSRKITPSSFSWGCTKRNLRNGADSGSCYVIFVRITNSNVTFLMTKSDSKITHTPQNKK